MRFNLGFQQDSHLRALTQSRVWIESVLLWEGHGWPASLQPVQHLVAFCFAPGVFECCTAGCLGSSSQTGGCCVVWEENGRDHNCMQKQAGSRKNRIELIIIVLRNKSGDCVSIFAWPDMQLLWLCSLRSFFVLLLRKKNEWGGFGKEDGKLDRDVVGTILHIQHKSHTKWSRNKWGSWPLSCTMSSCNWAWGGCSQQRIYTQHYNCLKSGDMIGSVEEVKGAVFSECY